MDRYAQLKLPKNFLKYLVYIYKKETGKKVFKKITLHYINNYC